MPSMNIGMQRRIGKLPKTAEFDSGVRNGYFDTLYGDGSNITGVNATTLDSIDSGSFLRSDAADTASGDITFSGGAGAATIAANSDIRLVNGNWTGNTTSPKIQAHGNYLYIAGGSNGIIFRENGTDRCRVDADGHFRPHVDSTYDIGTNSIRWRNVYADTFVGNANIGITTTTQLEVGTLGQSLVGITTILDEDNFASNSAAALATQQSIKAYVDAQITAEDLDFQADSGGALSIDLDSETLTFTGGTGIDTSGSGNAVTFAIDSTVATLTGSQTLTNKILTSPTITTPTVTGAMTATSVTTNDVTTNGSNADLDISPQGTGKVQFYGAYTFPTSDGTNGTALVTDGSGALSFSTVGDASASDDSAGVAIADKRITSTARTIDSFHATFQDSVLYYMVSNDHNEDCVNVQKVSVCHNDTTAFISSAGAQSKASTTMTTFTAALDNDMIRVKAASSNAVGGTLSFYKFGLGDNTSTGTSGNVIISQNADVDSASESLVSFAHATFRGAKLFISINNNAKTEVGNTEALVVHDGTDAFITQFGGIQTGDNPLLTLTAAIDGDNVVVSAAGGEANLRVTVHAIMLKDTMTSDDGTYANTEAIAPVTISSTATEVDTVVEASNNGAVYYLVSKNTSEGEYAVNEVFLAMGSGEITVASGPFVSTKGTNQLTFTADYKDDVENSGQLLCASTSGGSTTVSAYRINALAK